MSLESKLKDATLKPDEILRMIARRFGFSLGIPRHIITDNLIKTETEVSCKRIIMSNANVSCSLTLSNRYALPSYIYEYEGVVVEDNKINTVDYRALVIENAIGCRGDFYRFMVIRDKDTPKWFPMEDYFPKNY